jgi:hypothetical protein
MSCKKPAWDLPLIYYRPHALRLPTSDMVVRDGHRLSACDADRRQFDRKYDEGAEQVKRLLQRDKLELMGVQEIGAALRSEFDEENKAVAEVPWEQTEYGGASVKSEEDAAVPEPGKVVLSQSCVAAAYGWYC